MIDAALLEESKCYMCLGVSLPDALKMALLSRIADGGGGGGSQTPWSENINGGGFDLTNVNNINVTTINGAAPGAGITQLYTGAFADPNGNVTPDNLTISNSYCEDIVPPLNVWYWSVANQNWNQHSG